MPTARELFGRDKSLIGMIHIQALPGTPRSTLSVDAIAKQAAEEARILIDAGFDAILIENMHDVPYLRRSVGPEITAGMTAAGLAVRDAIGEAMPLGVQILAGANREALAVAQAIGGQFIRAEGFVFASVADEGLLDEADAGPLLRYRKAIGAESIHVIADIKKKHSAHAITADVDIAETARAAELFGADGLVVTGIATGRAVVMEDLEAVRSASDLPLVVGSGATSGSASSLLRIADAIIVGASIKAHGRWSEPVERKRAEAFVRAAGAAGR